MTTRDKGVESESENREAGGKVVDVKELASRCQDAETSSVSKRIEAMESCFVVGKPAPCREGEVALALGSGTVVTLREEDVIDVRVVEEEKDLYRVRVKRGVSGVFTYTRVMPLCKSSVGSPSPFDPFRGGGETASGEGGFSPRKRDHIYKRLPLPWETWEQDFDFMDAKEDRQVPRMYTEHHFETREDSRYGGGGGLTHDGGLSGDPIQDTTTCVIVSSETLGNRVRHLYLCSGGRFRKYQLVWGAWEELLS